MTLQRHETRVRTVAGTQPALATSRSIVSPLVGTANLYHQHRRIHAAVPAPAPDGAGNAPVTRRLYSALGAPAQVVTGTRHFHNATRAHTRGFAACGGKEARYGALRPLQHSAPTPSCLSSRGLEV